MLFRSDSPWVTTFKEATVDFNRKAEDRRDRGATPDESRATLGIPGNGHGQSSHSSGHCATWRSGAQSTSLAGRPEIDTISFQLPAEGSIGDTSGSTQCSREADHGPVLGVVWHDMQRDSRRSHVAANSDACGAHRTHGYREQS